MSSLHFISDWRQHIDEFLRSAKRPLIVVLGPTTSGKTDISICVAQAYLPARNIEIINADSRQCYQYLDIGTAKITREEMRGVPHHLLSVLDPKTECTIAWYQKEATRLIEEIHARGHIPMLVGGSMLYISSIIDGLQPIAGDPVIRKRLEDDYDQDAGIGLHKRLSKIDRETAAGTARQNKVYLVRAMEIFETTGRVKSDQLHSVDCPYQTLIIGVHREREQLIDRINRRTHQLIRSGWIEEVRSLLDHGYSIGDPSMKSHGYPEIAQALIDGADPLLAESVIAAKTRQYAKRQMTWWKPDQRIKWIAL